MWTVRRLLNYLLPMNRRSYCVTSKIVTTTDLRNIIRKSQGKSEQISNANFTATELPHVPETTRNCILRNMAFGRVPLKLLFLKNLRLLWVRNYMTLDLCWSLFPEEIWEILDRHDGWANVWVYFGDDCHQRWQHRQQDEGGLYHWRQTCLPSYVS